jgi:hypothetical protein
MAETPDRVTLCGLETYLYPHTGLLKGGAERLPSSSECQARVRGSTQEPLLTITMERMETHDLPSPPLLVTIFHYSIPEGMLGGASISINRMQATAYSVRCAPASRHA